jgi:hypothetical protein
LVTTNKILDGDGWAWTSAATIKRIIFIEVARGDNVTRCQICVSLQADVDKRGILASNDIIDTAFEDTANDTLTAFDV